MAVDQHCGITLGNSQYWEALSNLLKTSNCSIYSISAQALSNYLISLYGKGCVFSVQYYVNCTWQTNLWFIPTYLKIRLLTLNHCPAWVLLILKLPKGHFPGVIRRMVADHIGVFCNCFCLLFDSALKVVQYVQYVCPWMMLRSSVRQAIGQYEWKVIASAHKSAQAYQIQQMGLCSSWKLI